MTTCPKCESRVLRLYETRGLEGDLVSVCSECYGSLRSMRRLEEQAE